MDILLSHIQFFHFLLTQNTLYFRWIQSYCVTNPSIFKTVSFDTLIGKCFFPMLAELVGEYTMRLFITMTPFASVHYSSSPAASEWGPGLWHLPSCCCRTRFHSVSLTYIYIFNVFATSAEILFCASHEKNQPSSLGLRKTHTGSH